MTRLPLFIIGAVLMSATTAQAAEPMTGSGALALAALVGLQAPLPPAQRAVLSRLLEGRLPVRAQGPILIEARAVTCRAGNVDVSEHDCTLDFGTRTAKLQGRAAHELFATLSENGAPSDGAAGSIYEALSHLICTVDPAAVNKRDGSGASCTSTNGSKS